MTRWAALIAALLAASPAGAQCLGFQCPPGVLGAGASGAPLPLDGFTQPSGAYSFRKLKSNYGGPATRIRRASDNAELDVGFLGCTSFTGCPWDQAAAAAHCASTICFGRWWYDQSGAARDLGQATAANQPQLIFNCNGSLPCFQMTASTQVLAGASFTPASGIVSFSGVAARTGGSAGICSIIRENGATGNRLAIGTAANVFVLSGGTSGTISAAATDGIWHAAQGVVAAASSVLNIDGTETTGTATGSITAGVTAIGTTVAAPNICNFGESIFWDAYQLTAPERTFLRTNQQSFLGTP